MLPPPTPPSSSQLARALALSFALPRSLSSVLTVGQVQVGELFLRDVLPEIPNAERDAQHGGLRVAVVDVLMHGLRTDHMEGRALLPGDTLAVDDAVSDSIQDVQVRL